MKISIPEPCSEDWSKMTPTEQGAFCQKCALEVTDFTDKSSLEIKSILTDKIQSKQRVCGHIENRQLIEFNSEFIPWTSDRESFRAIWMFSLVAVFGMTLFSCQSTFSKEIVEKMNTSTEVLMEDEKDTLDIMLLNDSIMAINAKDSLLNKVGLDPWSILNPYAVTGTSIITTDGMMGLEIEPISITCVIDWMGDWVTIGSIMGPDSRNNRGQNTIDWANFFIDPIESREPLTPSPTTQAPRVNEQNQQNTLRIEAKLEKGKPEFVAHISPQPIDKTSKLFVTIPEEGILKLSIWELDSVSKIHSERFDLVFGNHKIDINFTDFPKGKYATQLIWEGEKVIVPFEISVKETC